MYNCCSYDCKYNHQINSKMKTPQNRFPNSVVILLCIITGLAVFLSTRYCSRPAEIKHAETEKTAIQDNIDSIVTHRNDIIESSVSKSNLQAAKSDSLYKTLKHEKPVIRDTTYAAMREYITNYPN